MAHDAEVNALRLLSVRRLRFGLKSRLSLKPGLGDRCRVRRDLLLILELRLWLGSRASLLAFRLLQPILSLRRRLGCPTSLFSASHGLIRGFTLVADIEHPVGPDKSQGNCQSQDDECAGTLHCRFARLIAGGSGELAVQRKDRRAKYAPRPERNAQALPASRFS